MSDERDSGDETLKGTPSNDDDSDPSERDSEPPSADEARTSARTSTRPKSRSRNGKRRDAAQGSRAAREAAAASNGSSRLALVGVLALVVGAAGGWFGHVAQANAKLKSESAPAASGSAAAAGPCGAWEEKICADNGAQSAACAQAKGASELLTPSACEAALAALPATLAKVKAGREPCDKLVTKLCGDLTPGSKACDLVKERTPSFPSERCKEMLGSYDQVLSELKMLEQQGGPQMPRQPGGMPMPPGGPAPAHP